MFERDLADAFWTGYTYIAGESMQVVKTNNGVIRYHLLLAKTP